MSYTYCNGVYVVTTDIRPNFKRFHTMNAQYSIFNIEDRFKCYQFVSYATNIMQAMHDKKHDSWIVSFNDNPFGYSRSTSRQISRFMQEYLPFGANDVQYAFGHCHSVTPDITTYNDGNITYDFHASTTFHNVWR